MTAPIYDYLQKLNKENPYPFHMPGHKRKSLYEMPNFAFDITEINGADNLHNPKGIIKEAQMLLAEFTKAEKSYFCVNGSSSGIIASIMSVCRGSDKILIARNCHRSVYSGVLLSSAIPVFVYPKMYKYIIGGISPKDVEEALGRYGDIKAVVLTSPTYEGFCSDIEKISKIVHKKSIPLIVDEAHGAHFLGYNGFPKSAISLGADISVQSWHKTLPVFTQCSVLNVKSKLIDLERLENSLSMVQTSSPSYIFMASVDKCREILEKQGKELFDEYLKRIENIRHMLCNFKPLSVIGHEVIGKSGIKDIDAGKLVFEINCNISANRLENMLIKDYNFQVEMISLHHIIFMTSIMDTDEGFERLYKAVKEINSKLKAEDNQGKYALWEDFPDTVISPKQAFDREKVFVPLGECAGLISGGFVIPYPPGIPLVIPGERITKDAVLLIQRFHREGIEVMGIKDGTVSVCLQ